MNGVLDIEIDPNIVLDEKVIKDMPDDIKTRLLATLTLGMERYDCDWTELTWKVEPSGIIKVKPK